MTTDWIAPAAQDWLAGMTIRDVSLKYRKNRELVRSALSEYLGAVYERECIRRKRLSRRGLCAHAAMNFEQAQTHSIFTQAWR